MFDWIVRCVCERLFELLVVFICSGYVYLLTMGILGDYEIISGIYLMSVYLVMVKIIDVCIHMELI